MEWMYYTPDTVAFSPLGYYVGNQFKLSPDTQTILENMNEKLVTEDKTLRTFRRSMGFNQTIQKELAPIMMELKKENEDVFFAAVRVCVNLTTPLECLLSTEELSKTEEGQQTLFELQQHLSEAKNIFMEQRLSRNIMEMMDNTLIQIQNKRDKISLIAINRNNTALEWEKQQTFDEYEDEQEELIEEDCQHIGSCITLLRNVLHIADDKSGALSSGRSSPRFSSSLSVTSSANGSAGGSQNGNDSTKETKTIVITSRQNQILWNLFSGNLDTVIIRLIGSSCLSNWCTSLLQLIALVYKDQHVSNLQNLLAQWLETEVSESSEDNESNTSPQDRNGSCTSPVLTSNETDDSYDDSVGHNNCNKEGSCNADASSVTDSGSECINDSIGNGNKSCKRNYTNVSSKFASTELEMQSDHSDPSKEPPLKKIAIIGGNELNQKLHAEDSVNFAKSNSSNTIKKNKKRKSYHLDILAADSSSSSNLCHTNNKERKMSRKEVKQEFATSSISSLENHNRNNNNNNNNKNLTGKRNNNGSSDYGYGSAQTMRNTVSSGSSNDDDVDGKQHVWTAHKNLQKPRPKKPNFTAAEKREIKRKILIKRAKSERMKSKALVHHCPTDDDIADLLKEFTVDFLLKGYATLVKELQKSLISNPDLHIDKSHFLWLITYFLKFASQLEVEMEQIGPVLSISILTYLVYEGVRLFEELELAIREQTVDLKPHLRRMHLVTTAIHEFIQTLGTYTEFSHFCKEDKAILKKLQKTCCNVKELRQLYLLLIRRFNPAVQSRQYLTDLIGGNHTLIVMMEKVKLDANLMSGHLKQFATVDVMKNYGLLLETFRTNTNLINDGIFTMMHHICGDLQRPEALFVPQILKAFSDMWAQEEVVIFEDWSDLIGYVIQKFIGTLKNHPQSCTSTLLEGLDTSEGVDENGFTKKQLDDLCHFFSQSEHMEDPVGQIIEMYKANGSITKTRLAVIQALMAHGMITHAQYMGLMYMKSVLSSKTYHEGSVVAEDGSLRCDSECLDGDIEPNSDGGDRTTTPNNHQSQNQRPNQDLEVLKDLLKKQGKEYLIKWLQEILLDTCQVNLNGEVMELPEGKIQEPVIFYYNHLNQSIPLVPWNKQQESGLQSETFILLLHKLGFHLAADVGKCFPRIPHFWSSDHILHLAQKLGPIYQDDVSFDISMLMASTESCASVSRSNSPVSNLESSCRDLGKWKLQQQQQQLIPQVTMPQQTQVLPPKLTPLLLACETSGSPRGDTSEYGSNASSPMDLNSQFGLFPNSITAQEQFAVPVPTNNWLHMALMSKKFVTNLSSSGIVSTSNSPPICHSSERSVTRTTHSGISTTITSRIVMSDIELSSKNVVYTNNSSTNNGFKPIRDENNSMTFEKMHISDMGEESD